jgi:hypothetical protein
MDRLNKVDNIGGKSSDEKELRNETSVDMTAIILARLSLKRKFG